MTLPGHKKAYTKKVNGTVDTKTKKQNHFFFGKHRSEETRERGNQKGRTAVVIGEIGVGRMTAAAGDGRSLR